MNKTYYHKFVLQNIMNQIFLDRIKVLMYCMLWDCECLSSASSVRMYVQNECYVFTKSGASQKYLYICTCIFVYLQKPERYEGHIRCSQCMTTFARCIGRVLLETQEMDSWRCLFYGQMDQASESQLPSVFRKSDSSCRCLISTVAFRLGMDIPDITYVLHWGPPTSHLQYWQEVGRAGREGRDADAILYIPPYSMDKRRTDESVRLSVKCCKETCFRREVLKSLKTEGMTDEEINSCCGHKRCCTF